MIFSPLNVGTRYSIPERIWQLCNIQVINYYITIDDVSENDDFDICQIVGIFCSSTAERKRERGTSFVFSVQVQGQKKRLNAVNAVAVLSGLDDYNFLEYLANLFMRTR